jgi:hypothetical protein
VSSTWKVTSDKLFDLFLFHIKMIESLKPTGVILHLEHLPTLLREYGKILTERESCSSKILQT